MRRSYCELLRLDSFLDRFNYLKLGGIVGRPTFGSERWMNQRFYTSIEWRHVRDFVIARDNGFDLGCPDRPIAGKIMVHHLNPLTPEAIKHSDDLLLDPDNLICCSIITHNAIHYGDDSIARPLIERHPNDTCPWKVRGQNGRTF